MYIKKVVLENIRSISRFEMNFSKPAGWHVLIGDNGSGKTSVVQAIGLALLDSIVSVYSFGLNLSTFLRDSRKMGSITIKLSNQSQYDSTELGSNSNLKLKIDAIGFIDMSNKFESGKPERGWFLAGFGPQRRFSEGQGFNYYTDYYYQRKDALRTLFNPNFTIDALEWIKELDHKRLIEIQQKNGSKENTIAYEGLKKLINESALLPHGVKFERVDLSRFIVFQDANKNFLSPYDLSDGYRSILSLTFELIRQMVNAYGSEAVFQDINQGKMEINLPGVVLIDEIDAHLHPSWQVKIGKWFQQYFPQLQFIVTTHSPLICRACEKGSIWRLAAPGSEEESGEITGAFRERLIHGNILDAYGTEVFGKETVRSAESDEKLARLGQLNMLRALGKISTEDEKERLKLQKTLPTDAATGFTALATK
jgi:predicted ATP-binding protein involved in virulence